MKLLKENFESDNLYDKLSLLTEVEVKRIVGGLDWVTQNLDAVLVGGTAVVHYLKGGRDLTPDIDFMVSDINKVKEKLDNDGIPYTLLKNNMGISIDQFNTDILDYKYANDNNKVLNTLILKTPKLVKINDKVIKSINPYLLAILKFELGRTKDLNDALALMNSGLLNKEQYLKYVNALKNSLNDYESLVGYAEML
jgi:hypothetical protein